MDPVFRDTPEEVWKEELEEIESYRSIRRCRKATKAAKYAVQADEPPLLGIVKKKCKRSIKSGKKAKHARRASEPCRKGRGLSESGSRVGKGDPEPADK